MHVLIAGGGIGGLVLAQMLAARGVAATVLEAAREVRPLGVGINLLPHAVRELMALGLLPALDEAGIRTRELRYLNHLGQTLWAEPRGAWAGHDAPQFSIHRGQLHALLWRAAAARLGERLRSAASVVGFSEDADGVEVTLGDGSRMRGDALIGADGIHSTVRAALHPADGGVRWQGIQMWRGAVSWPTLWDGQTMCIAGDTRAKLVLYPIGAGAKPSERLLNWVVYARQADAGPAPPGRQDWSREAPRGVVTPQVAHFRLPFIDPAALITASAMASEYPMCDRDPLPWWTRGRVTLLGDAAHPMYPVGSNGASQAILDARCLADALAAEPVVPALAAYEAERLPKTAAIVASNRVGGPERVIDFVAERAPQGFTDIDQVASHEELAAIVGGYATLAGFAVPRT
ncbi:MAG: FAD-dependent monooxygenase [Gammaproteobacteria bacterium]|nr:FAD-dependent monooxygenase [Gammaproteobacteria bacterium]